jgi:hypothetical protein
MSREADGWAQHDRDEAAMFRVAYEDGRASRVYDNLKDVCVHLENTIDLDAYIQHRRDGAWVTYRGPRV